jgi:hypothetical protein
MTAPCPPPRAGSVASYSQTPTQDVWKACNSPPVSACPEHQNCGGTRVFSHSLYFPMPTTPHLVAEDGCTIHERWNQLKNSLHTQRPLSLPSPPFGPGDDQAAPRAPTLLSALPKCPTISGMPETENLLSLTSMRPRDCLESGSRARPLLTALSLWVACLQLP